MFYKHFQASVNIDHCYCHCLGMYNLVTDTNFISSKLETVQRPWTNSLKTV